MAPMMQPDHAVIDQLDAYDVQAVVFDGDPTRIYRARRLSDGMPVMLKALRDESAARQAAACLKHEYEITRRLMVPTVIRALALEQQDHLTVIVFEDFGGDSLNLLARRRRFEVEELLRIAIQVARGLMEIHAANIIHKDINPSNIVYNPDSGVVKIIDFGISTALTREQAAVASAEVFEGSLPYISPEQTGRMNRAIDYRTDFYSFGATLYELLTGRPLFVVSEPIEWFHCHIAKQPVPPAEVDARIPRVLSDMVMKMLAKTAEERYQSARGIHADLQDCLDEWVAEGRITPFDLGQQDVTDRFQIPQRLYGRQKEVQQLLDAFALAGDGPGRMVLVSGYSGIGKTCLVKEIYKPVTERKGFFIAGKFDQLQRNMPYRAVAGALRDLVRQLLTEPEERLAKWRNGIMEALGANAGLIVDGVPDLALIVGPATEPAPLPPLEAEQRFHRTFRNFIQLFCKADHPLAIFLDDLQWADNASLRLIDLLIGGDARVPHLLLIGAYRDNELRPGHPVTVWLKERQAQGAFSDEIRLQPLTADALTVMVADTLGAAPSHVAPLADLVAAKTGGNPFFTEEFLKTLHRRELIIFSHTRGCWQWDVERIREQDLTDNVVALLTAKLRQLAPQERQALELAACIGFTFSLDLLARISQEPAAVVAGRLQAPILEGLVAPIGDAYQLIELEMAADVQELTVTLAFAHDRIQQAAYNLLDDERRLRAHLTIGRFMRESLAAEVPEAEQLFATVNHLNLGASLMDDTREIGDLCRLNLAAGRQAKQSNAYPAALDYFQQALALPAEDLWQADYALALALQTDAAEAAYLSGAYETMDDLLAVGFAQAKQDLDQVPLYVVQLSACMARDQLKEAIDIALPLLARFGHRYPAKATKAHVVLRLLRLQRRLRKVPMDTLRQLPLMTEPRHLAAMAIGERIGGAAMFTQPHLLPLMIIKAVEVSLDQGITRASLTSFASYGMILAQALGQVERGDAFGQLAQELTQRLKMHTIEGRVRHVYNALVRHWREPVCNCLDPLDEAFRMCLEHGDFEYAAHAVCVRQLYEFSCGVPLERLAAEIERYQETLQPLRQGSRVHYLECTQQTVANLRGQAEDPALLKGRHYDIERMMADHEGSLDKSLISTDLTMQMYMSYSFGRHAEALAYADKALPYSGRGAQAMYLSLTHYLTDGLIRMANVPSAGKAQRRRLLRQAAGNHAKLKRVARTNPANAANKERLLAAAMLQARGRDFEAHAAYDDAIRLSREHGFINEESLACELCGTMHAAAGRDTLADPYLAKARDLYSHWGAKAKVDDLLVRYPRLAKPVPASVRGTTAKTGTWGASAANIDLGALTKALKAIAEETAHSRMVEVIITTAMAFAGAQHGMLLLRNPDGELCVEAEACVDRSDARILQSIPVAEAPLSQAVVNYVSRTLAAVVVHDAQAPNDQIPGLLKDPCIRQRQVRSVLCLPLLTGRGDGGELIGMLYLENNRASATFTEERFATLEIIGMSAAGRLELSRKAVIDGLTELFNHDYFQNLLGQEFDAARRHGRQLAVILMDIDHFKQFNDTWGHQVGDQVLREVARIIKTGCRGEDTAARYGGEEMAVILPMADLKAAEQVGERIRRAVAHHQVMHNDQPLSVTISVGVAVLDGATQDKETLIRRADDALYRAKDEGRNCCRLG